MKILVPSLLVVLSLSLPAPLAAGQDGERRWLVGVAGASSQSRLRAGSDLGGNENTLHDALLVRAARLNRPWRYGADAMQVNYDEARLRVYTGWLDYVRPAGQIFSWYGGAAAGLAGLKWRDDDPLGAGRDFGVRGDTTMSWVAGLRLGGLIEVTDLVQVEIGYRYLITGLNERFRDGDARGEVRVRDQRVVHGGVNFRF